MEKVVSKYQPRITFCIANCCVVAGLNRLATYVSTELGSFKSLCIDGDMTLNSQFYKLCGGMITLVLL